MNYDEKMQQVANVLRTHQFDEGVGDKFPGRCFCGNQMGDQEEHQAMALIQDGIVPVDEMEALDYRSGDD